MTAKNAAQQAASQFYEAVNWLQRSDQAFMLALWSHGVDITNMGPHGGQQRGW